MYKIRVLHSEDLVRLLTMKDVVAAVETAYEQYSNKEAGLFPVIVHEFEPGMREMDIKSGYLSGTGLAGLKLIGYVADNPDKRRIPAISGLVVVISIETGRPVGILDGMIITNIRTGAAGAIGAKYLARKDSENVLVVGSGAQGRAQVRGLLSVLPDIRRIWIAGRDGNKLATYVEEMSSEYVNVSFEAVSMNDLGSKAAKSDIIVTCTPAHEPFIRKEWIRPGTHINAVGADFPGKQEIDETLLPQVRLVADCRVQTLELGEMQTAYRKGLISENDVDEIGEIISGSAPGRESSDEITLFDATGMALQDIVTANLALTRASEQGIGSLVMM
ncbi:MAG: ornithine cyclodeaminase family protein [Thermovirgaceae bacterium]|nr:ornithine cyclodeaminase family protein [Thermovirgaceae bacterium]